MLPCVPEKTPTCLLAICVLLVPPFAYTQERLRQQAVRVAELERRRKEELRRRKREQEKERQRILEEKGRNGRESKQ